MSLHFKPYLFILLGILLGAILLNAPVAFAFKMPTACNIFNKTQIEKSGPCAHLGIFAKDKPIGHEVLSSETSALATSDSLRVQNNFSSLVVPSPIISKPAALLRC